MYPRLMPDRVRLVTSLSPGSDQPDQTSELWSESQRRELGKFDLGELLEQRPQSARVHGYRCCIRKPQPSASGQFRSISAYPAAILRPGRFS
jgi:hypothetical protein